MPHKPPHPCAQPGCPNLTHAPRCPSHTTTTPWAGSRRKQRLGTSRWAEQQSRQRILERDNRICHVCHQPGADEVDHIIPLAEDGTDTDDNKAAIHADPCHKRKTQAEATRARWPNRQPKETTE